MEFINRKFSRYEAVKMVKPRNNGTGGYVRIPTWLIGYKVKINFEGGVEVFEKLVVSTMGGGAVLFPSMLLGIRARISYKANS